MGADNEKTQAHTPHRSRALTNPSSTPQRSHRSRPSLEIKNIASRSQVPRPSSSRAPPDTPDRPSAPKQSPQQTVTSPRSPTSGSISRPRGRSISSPLQTTSPNTALSPGSYFSPQPSSSGNEARSPAFRRPPASHSSHGLENSRGPPIALITRGSYSLDIARHIEGKNQTRADFGLAQQQLVQLGLISPGGTPKKNKSGGRGAHSRSSSVSGEKKESLAEETKQKGTMDSDDPVSSSFEELSENEPARKKDEGRTTHVRRSTETDTRKESDRTSMGEDLFLNIAEDSPPTPEDEKNVRRRSRIARASHRQSLPTNTYTPPAARPASKGSEFARTPSQSHQRRASQVPAAINTRLPLREPSPMSAAAEQRIRGIPQPSQSPFSATRPPREHEMPSSVPQFSRRRPSNADSNHTPPARSQTYRRSNLQYTSSNQDQNSQNEDATSRDFPKGEGTESVDSGPAPSTIFDEVEDLKYRLRQVEGQLTKSTTGTAASNASNERPRTATTTVTTISSSPRQRRKTNSPSEQDNDLHTTLTDGLARCKEYLSPAVYRSLETTAKEALELAAISGTTGPQGTALTVASMLNSNNQADRQVRRRAHNICQSLTELCVNLCEGKITPASPFRQLNHDSRRTSMQFTSENREGSHTPSYTHARSGSIEPEGYTAARSPSRALSRIEARRTSFLANGLDRGSRHVSEEPPTPSYSRLNRAGTTLLNSRQSMRDGSAGPFDDDEESTIRVPSRAMTEYGHLRAQPSSAPRTNRYSREYTSQEPLPHYQSSPITQTPSLRPTPSYSTTIASTVREGGAKKYYDRAPVAAASFEREERPSVYRQEERRRLTQPGGGRYETAADARDSPLSGISRTGSLGNRRMTAARRFGTNNSSSVNSGSLD